MATIINITRTIKINIPCCPAVATSVGAVVPMVGAAVAATVGAAVAATVGAAVEDIYNICT